MEYDILMSKSGQTQAKMCLKVLNIKIMLYNTFTYPMYTAGVIQVYMGHYTARLQNCSRSLDKVNTTRLLHSQRHHHLHHLKRQHKQPVNENTQHVKKSILPKNLPHSPQSLHRSLLHKHDLHPQSSTAAVYQQRATSALWDLSPSQIRKSCCQQ